MKYTAGFLRSGLIPATGNHPVVFKFNSNRFLTDNLEPGINLCTIKYRMRILKDKLLEGVPWYSMEANNV